MNKKIHNLKEIQYYTNFNLVGEIILKLKKKYPDNEKIEEATQAMNEIGFYVQELISDRHMFEQALSEYRGDKLRAIKRARRAEDELEQIKGK